MRVGTWAWRFAALLLTFAPMSLAQSAAYAQSPAEFYKGRNVELYIGYSVGGAYDLYARVLARHLGKHIPGSPTIIPKNMEGAGSLRLALCDVIGADRAIRARPVLDDDVLPEQRLELVGEYARDEIGRSAGREGDDHADDAGGKVLRTGIRGCQPSQRNERDGHSRRRSARELHVNLAGSERGARYEVRSHPARRAASRAREFAQSAGIG